MTPQTWITFALAALAAAYFFRSSLRSLLGRGCASGCGTCQSGGCPAKKLQAVQERLDKLPPKGI